MTVCNDGFHRLGNLAKHVKPRFIVETKVLPIAIDNLECDLHLDEISLTKAQVGASVYTLSKLSNLSLGLLVIIEIVNNVLLNIRETWNKAAI